MNGKKNRWIHITIHLCILFSLVSGIQPSEILISGEQNYTNINTNKTIQPIDVWEYTEKNHISIGMWSSFIQAFTILFTSEIADKTYIIILFFATKNNNNKLCVFLASSLAVLLMNYVSILLGYSAYMLLYKNLIDWIVFLTLLLYGISLISEGREIELKEERRDSFSLTPRNSNRNDINESNLMTKSQSLPVIHEAKDSYFNSNADSLQEPMLIKENNPAFDLDPDQESLARKSKGRFHNFWFFFSSVVAAECGDRSQISTIAISAVFNVYGVLFGTSLALILSILINVYYGQKILKYLSEKQINYICGFILTLCALEIILIKLNL